MVLQLFKNFSEFLHHIFLKLQTEDLVRILNKGMTTYKNECLIVNGKKALFLFFKPYGDPF